VAAPYPAVEPAIAAHAYPVRSARPAERVEAYGGTARAHSIAELSCEPITNEDPKSFPHARDLAEPVVEFADVE
jgi:hypothetical protein